ncbi:hypothetical protein J5275_08130 [Rhizobium sp. L245/93]|nr:hypothetical protein [Rhizobium sp. L245/93]
MTAALIIGWYARDFAARGQLTAIGFSLDEKKRNLDEAETRFLYCHQRELANILLEESPDKLRDAYLNAKRRQDAAIESGPERVTAELNAMAAKFPMFRDFELVGTRHFIPYCEGLVFRGAEDFKERHLNISHWLALKAFLKSGSNKLLDDEDRAIMDRTVQQEEDRLLRNRIDTAMAERRAFDRGIDSFGAAEAVRDRPAFDTGKIRVERALDWSPEISYRLTFKERAEYAIYSFFVHEGGKITYSYRRSDETFRKAASLR